MTTVSRGRIIGTAAMVASLTASGGFIGLSSSSATAHASSASSTKSVGSSPVNTAPTNRRNGHGPAGFGGHAPRGMGGRQFGMGHLGRNGLIVTTVSGRVITVTGHNGQSETIDTTAATKATQAGTTVPVSSIAIGSVIDVSPSADPAQSSTTIQATSISIVLPAVNGIVTAASASDLTVSSFDGESHTVHTYSGTTLNRLDKTASLSDIQVGSSVRAEGTTQSDGSLTALQITLNVPMRMGKATAVTPSSITLQGRGTTLYSVSLASSPTYATISGTAATAADVKVGTMIVAQGSISSDGKTVTAEKITVLPAFSGTQNNGPGDMQ